MTVSEEPATTDERSCRRRHSVIGDEIKDCRTTTTIRLIPIYNKQRPQLSKRRNVQNKDNVRRSDGTKRSLGQSWTIRPAGTHRTDVPPPLYHSTVFKSTANESSSEAVALNITISSDEQLRCVLGRRDLCETWWKNCPNHCNAHIPGGDVCPEFCSIVRRKKNLQSLSRKMILMEHKCTNENDKDSSATTMEITVHPECKCKALIHLYKQSDRLVVLLIGDDASAPWMRFHFESTWIVGGTRTSHNLVTPPIGLAEQRHHSVSSIVLSTPQQQNAAFWLRTKESTARSLTIQKQAKRRKHLRRRLFGDSSGSSESDSGDLNRGFKNLNEFFSLEVVGDDDDRSISEESYDFNKRRYITRRKRQEQQDERSAHLAKRRKKEKSSHAHEATSANPNKCDTSMHAEKSLEKQSEDETNVNAGGQPENRNQVDFGSQFASSSNHSTSFQNFAAAIVDSAVKVISDFQGKSTPLKSNRANYMVKSTLTTDRYAREVHHKNVEENNKQHLNSDTGTSGFLTPTMQLAKDDHIRTDATSRSLPTDKINNNNRKSPCIEKRRLCIPGTAENSSVNGFSSVANDPCKYSSELTTPTSPALTQPHLDEAGCKTVIAIAARIDLSSIKSASSALFPNSTEEPPTQRKNDYCAPGTRELSILEKKTGQKSSLGSTANSNAVDAHHLSTPTNHVCNFRNVDCPNYDDKKSNAVATRAPSEFEAPHDPYQETVNHSGSNEICASQTGEPKVDNGLQLKSGSSADFPHSKDRPLRPDDPSILGSMHSSVHTMKSASINPLSNKEPQLPIHEQSILPATNNQLSQIDDILSTNNAALSCQHSTTLSLPLPKSSEESSLVESLCSDEQSSSSREDLRREGTLPTQHLSIPKRCVDQTLQDWLLLRDQQLQQQPNLRFRRAMLELITARNQCKTREVVLLPSLLNNGSMLAEM